MSLQPHFTRSKGGFTLVELLVSMAILTLLMLVLASITDATQRTWSYTTGKVEQFRDSREAFESITRKLSQATLNTYWDYEYPIVNGKPDTTQPPLRYIRQSELRFISGQALTLTGSDNMVTHAVFFQAPLGHVDDTAYANLNTLLNTWGYFVEFGSDRPWRPPFINDLTNPPAERYRFRIMELMQPSESLSLYDAEVNASGGNAAYTGTEWFNDSLKKSPPDRPARVVADNVLAMVLLPKLTPSDQDKPTKGTYNDSSLAPTYLYDSTAKNMVTKSDANLNPKNQLPPVVQVTMVAVDEASYNRLQLQNGETQPDDLFKDSSGNKLFQTVGDTLNKTLPGYAKDMESLQRNLQTRKLNYRVFTTNVSLKAAKWSRVQKEN